MCGGTRAWPKTAPERVPTLGGRLPPVYPIQLDFHSSKSRRTRAHSRAVRNTLLAATPRIDPIHGHGVMMSTTADAGSVARGGLRRL